MAERDESRAEQQGDGQPENIRELQDSSGGSAMSRQGRGPAEAAGSADLPESAMGGTSDAGSAADDAAEGAALHRGLPDDLTRQTGRRGTEGR